MCSFTEAFWAKHIAALPEPDEYLNGILRSLQAANRFLQGIYHSGLWLSQERTRMIAQSGLDFLRYYQTTSHRAFKLQKTRFKLTPKYHALIHIIDVLVVGCKNGHRWTLSPLAESTQTDEDLVGRVSLITTRVSSRAVHTQTLQRYLMEVSTHLRE